MSNTLYKIARSWCEKESSVNSTDEILAWIRERNETVHVSIFKNRLEDSDAWLYDENEGRICNKNRSFFSISGFECRNADGITVRQPIILQMEIGYIGIICKEIDGVMHFLMQAKIEPGNVNKVQISPTVQATKSNFMQLHGGARPPYLEYFLDAGHHEVVVDQVQSEQSSRFYQKRNRNVIIRVDEEVPVLATHRWMTLGQIKRLMREENLVNMDARTGLSCIPFAKLRLTEAEWKELKNCFSDQMLYSSAFEETCANPLPQIYQYINNFKMFSEPVRQVIPLHQLSEWEMRDGEFVCKHPYPFKVVFCDISIEGREVKRWTQPLFEAIGIATFGLLFCEDEGKLKFLVKAMPEVGCMDMLELGPTVQREAVALSQEEDVVSKFFFECLAQKQGVIFDQLLSEEGGRFYHEQNRNVLLKVKREEIPDLPEGYFLLDYHTLNELVQINNTLNIQLRNLLVLLEA